MVLKTTLCKYSGLRIYPGRGLLYIRLDGTQFLFLNRKTRSLYHQRKRPAKLAWCYAYRKAHKKDIVQEQQRRKRKGTSKSGSKSIVGTSLDVIRRIKSEKPEFRQHQREAALREVKERQKKTKQEKAAKKSEVKHQKMSKSSKPIPNKGGKGAGR